MSTYYVTTVGAKLPDLIDTLNTLGGNLITPVKDKKDTFILSGPPITATVIEDLQEQELIHYSRLEDPVTVTERSNQFERPTLNCYRIQVSGLFLL